MQRNARGTYKRDCKLPGECREMQWNARGTYGSGCKVPGECGECRGMPGKRIGVSVKCQGNAGECKGMPGNIWEWVQSARGMQVNATATYGSGAVPEECRKCWGMPGERMGVGTKCQGNVGECKGMPGNIWEWVQSAMGMHGSVQSAMGMWEDARGMYGCGWLGYRVGERQHCYAHRSSHLLRQGSHSCVNCLLLMRGGR